MEKLSNHNLKLVGFRLHPFVDEVFRNTLLANNNTAREVLSLSVYNYINTQREQSMVQKIKTDDSEFVSWTKYKRQRSLGGSA